MITIVTISLILLFLGILQIYSSMRKPGEIKEKMLLKNAHGGQRKNDRFYVFFVAKTSFLVFVKKLKTNLIGDKKELLSRNLIILFLGSGGAIYVNVSFLGFSNTVTLMITFPLIIYILYVGQIKKKRQAFERDFSEALNIINSVVRVGQPIMQGFEECSKNIDSDFGREFGAVIQRLDIGDEPERVFMDSYKRYPYGEYFSFIITVLINMRGGGQVSEVMSRLTTLISASRMLERKKIAMTAEARMSVKVLVIIPVFFFFFLKFVAPDNFDILVGTTGGQYILYYAIGSILTGLLIVWSMMNKVG